MITDSLRQTISSPILFSNSVRTFWSKRDKQVAGQKERGTQDQGNRCAVTGGAQMDGFVNTIKDLLIEIGVPKSNIYSNTKLELPGYFRANKKWDMIVVNEGDHKEKELIAAIEFKSQIGPSFGNNFNNRTEEALGSSVDILTAYREGVFSPSPNPWLGYLMLLEDCIKTQQPVAAKEPHFKVLPEFVNASYQGRYHQFCLKLVRERRYTSVCFLTADLKHSNEQMNYSEIDQELSGSRFVLSLLSHVEQFL